MKFGVFDHVDRSGAPLAAQYEDRLKLIEAYEVAGFHGYHIAEHHSTPLGMAPSPGIFLAAVAQRTKTLRFGPLVYPLPLYHPLRAAEEICMLDHLSGGRLDIGFGRGASQFEIEYYGVDPKEAQARYEEGRAIVLAALTSESLTYNGRYHRFEGTPIEMRPLQQPFPRLFYGAGHPETAAKAARDGINLVCNATVTIVKPIFDRFRSEWKAREKSAADMPLLGLNRHCVVADTDREAEAIAERAYRLWHASFHRLWQLRNARPNNATYPDTFAALQKAGLGVAGSPATVRDFYVREIGEVRANYALGRFAFGDLTLAESKRSVDLFKMHVMPALGELRVSS
jgi:alkanesulfonate monooxygenase SsuD/methylene tetrahydromethanopterin reductase-like flavin-dependent oxidoreductase (luciferase family)